MTMMRKKYLIGCLLICFSSCIVNKPNDKSSVSNHFSFAFLTDIHLQHEMGASKAFERVIDSVNRMNPDFVQTGGDLIFDVLRGNRPRADSLFKLYTGMIKRFKMPVYNVIGNHELFGIYAESPIQPNDPDYKYGMFKKYLGDTYYSFDHKGWHFIALNSIDERNKRYIGIIDEAQKEWLRKDIESVKREMPIVLITHIPFVSVQHQIIPPKNPVPCPPNEIWISNRNEILDMFREHNLRLVLQGHLHWLEDVKVGNTRFITGGAVAGRPSWKGNNNGEQGFMIFDIKDQHISWRFVNYGWKNGVNN